jgi:hypothetical protein
MLIKLTRLMLIGLIAVAVAASGAAAQNATPGTGTPTALGPVPAEYYELRGPGLLVTIEAPAIADVLPTLHIDFTYYPEPATGEPAVDIPDTFTFDGPPEEMQAFPGDGGSGWLLTVTVSVIPDFGRITLSLLMPIVNLVDEAVGIDTLAILTTQPDSIGGPALVTGPLQTYQIVPLSGFAGHAGP